MVSLRTRFAQLERRQIVFGLLSILLTIILMVGFLIENRWGYSKRPPMLIYAENWSESRTRSEAVAAQKVDMAEQMRLYREQQEAIAKEKQEAVAKEKADAAAKKTGK